MDALTLMELADDEALAGRGDRALPPARRAVALYPGEGAVHAALARAWLAAGVPDSARAEVDRALAAAWHDAAERRNAETLRDDLAGSAPPSRRRPRATDRRALKRREMRR